MKYLCLVYAEERRLEEIDDAECIVSAARVHSSGHAIAAEALQPVHTATTLRVRDGTISITDGPFAETKEQLTGFYLIEARDLNEALQIAGRIPAARVGCVEVRPVRQLQEIR